MSKKSIILLCLLILSPIIIYFLWPTDESRIKKLFREGAKAIENRKVEDVMSKVSYNYTDEYGLTYIYMKEALTRIFKRMDNFSVEYKINKIEVKENAATAEVEVRVIASAGQDTGYIVGDAGKPVQMIFYLEKVRTKWLVNKTEGLKYIF
jgi:hypothetical protein